MAAEGQDVNMKNSMDMFDSSGEDESRNVPTSCIMSENGVHPGWSGVPLTSLPRLPPHGSAPPAPPPVPGSCHTVAVKLPLQVNTFLVQGGQWINIINHWSIIAILVDMVDILDFVVDVTSKWSIGGLIP